MDIIVSVHKHIPLLISATSSKRTYPSTDYVSESHQFEGRKKKIQEKRLEPPKCNAAFYRQRSIIGFEVKEF